MTGSDQSTSRDARRRPRCPGHVAGWRIHRPRVACSSYSLEAIATAFAAVMAVASLPSLAHWARAEDGPPPPTQPAVAESRAVDERFYLDEVRPLLVAKCVSCHGPEKQEGALRLDSLAAALRGGDRGPAVVPGDTAKSLLVKAVEFTVADLAMPPKQKLAAKEIETLARWVKAGAPAPAPPAVLFDDDPAFLSELKNGNGRGRLVSDQAFLGQAALAITPLQRDNPRVAGWRFAIREQPGPGEHRYLRLAWRKRGAGSVMVELAADGNWPDAKSPKGRYVAGPNTTGWAAIQVAPQAPVQWTIVTFDLWKDIGAFTLTGLAPTCDRGDEAYFDALLLGPSLESLDSFLPGAAGPADLGRLAGARGASGSLVTPGNASEPPVGDAFTDPRNPIRKLFRGERLDLWSLRPPVQRPLPPTQAGIGGDSAIDAWVGARLAAARIAPSPEADKRTLIRRLTYDLTGLPPTPAEVAAFLADSKPTAYDTVVDRLLASPRYGERQARMWLDVVRYADTNGYERDEFRPLMWRYRDYVIRSFNDDKPYDQFIQEQLAGDELLAGPPQSPADVEKLVATGFLRLGQWDSTAAIFQEETRLRAEMMADVTNTTGAAFLGLTLSCCQCHDHKYDPLAQADHYRFRAFFAAVQPRDNLAIATAAEQAEIDRHNAALEKEAEPLKSEQAKLDKADKKRQEELQQKLAAIAARKREPPRAMAAGDSGASAPPTPLLYQGDHSAPREDIAPGFVSLLSPGPAPIAAPRPNTTGRRLTLARWIVSPDNPWTARVLVNRLWQQHFGIGLVATPNDFGYTGARPTHPELLDWLAIDFQNNGWSLKKLHRRIVRSRTYRQASRVRADAAADPDNRLLWRQNVQRLDAETLRDSLLSVSGLLQPHAAGKPLWPPVAEELLKAQPAILEAEKGGDGGRMQGWYADPQEQTDARSVFLVRKRCLPIPFLQAFDLPDTTTSCGRRDTTVVAPQALMLLNSEDGLRFAKGLAARLSAGGPDPRPEDAAVFAAWVDRLFQETLGRDAVAEEKQLAAELTRRHRDQYAAAGPAEPAGAPRPAGAAEPALRRALVDLCRAVLNANEFLYLD